MDGIEQRVRDSLQARAGDVAPTPMLWQEVDRRITRRKRFRVSVLALAGSAAVILGVLVLPGLFGSSFRPIEIEPFVQPEPPATEDAAPGDDDQTDEGTPDVDEGQSGPTPGVDSVPLLVADQNEIRLLGPDGDVTLHTFDPEGEMTFVTGLAVRPGSTPDDLTAAVMTMSEGYVDLRELRVIDGEVSLEFVPETYRPASRPTTVETASVSVPLWSTADAQADDGQGDDGPADVEVSGDPYRPPSAILVTDGARISNPVWSPDGDALVWLEEGLGQITVRIIGWSDGPGTGRTADDNTRIDVTGLPSMLNLDDWVQAGDDTTLIRGTTDDGGEGMYVIPVDRQGDGAWAISQDPQLIELGDLEIGTVSAVAGNPSPDGRSVRFEVRLGQEFVLAVDGVDAFDLPGDLLPSGEGGGDGLASLWVVDLGDHALVGSRSTGVAYLVDYIGDLTRIEGAAGGDGVQ